MFFSINFRLTPFFVPEDKEQYLNILKLQSKAFGLDIWAYCLKDNHVHMIVVPREAGSMTLAVSETHRMYTRMINFRKRWRGYLWQGRYKSFVMNERYLFEAVRYVEMNPVRAGMVKRAADYGYSSAKAHVCARKKDKLLSQCPLEGKIHNWAKYLREGTREEILAELRKSELTGRPLGDNGFIQKLEGIVGRVLQPQN